MIYAYMVRTLSPYGALTYTYANNDSVGIRPALHLDPEVLVEGDGAFDEVFTICE